MTKAPDIRGELQKAWRLATAPLRMMPSFVIAGSPKCGTSTLYDWIAAHPRVRRGARKEPTNFLHYPGSRLRSAMHYPIAGFNAAGRLRCGDGSVEYFSHPDGPANVRAVIPQARLVFLFRDPVKRAWSDFQMFRRSGMDSHDFARTTENAIRWLGDPGLQPLVDAATRQSFNPVRYVINGQYCCLARRWLEVFPREQILFLISEEFFSEPAEVTRRVFAHLGLDPVDVRGQPVARKGGYSDWMDSETEGRLRDFYAPQNRQLEELLERTLPW